MPVGIGSVSARAPHGAVVAIAARERHKQRSGDCGKRCNTGSGLSSLEREKPKKRFGSRGCGSYQ
jgi:hypothetical protein